MQRLLYVPIQLSRRSRARVSAVALAVLATFTAGPAAALSLGNPDVVSFLGQPLHLRVPVAFDPADGSAQQCVHLIGQPGGDVPSLTVARVDIERGPTGSVLRVTTSQPIDEPVLRVALEIGCTQRMRREFTLLIDPPVAYAGRNEPQAAEVEIDFGPPQVVGGRGQPLLVNVPIFGTQIPSLSPACVRTGRSDSADSPRVLNDARVDLVDRDGGRLLRIHTPEPVNDARVRVMVEVGCQRPYRREFFFQLEAPRLAATPSEGTAPAVTPAAPVKRPVSKPAPRVAPPAAPPAVPPVLATAPAQPLETPAANQAQQRRVEPPPAPSRPPQPSPDRLILTAPEDLPPGPTQREIEVLKRMDELSAEIKKLRAELDAAALRNRELAEKANSASIAWAAAAGAALLLGLVIIFGWRARPRNEDTPAPNYDRQGPMTRILGKHVEQKPVVVPPPQMTDGAGPATIAAIAAAHRAHEQDTQGASSAIMVTEFRDTTQVIGELYSSYVEKGPTTTRPGGAVTQPGGPLTQPGPQTKTEIALDLDLGQERTTVFSPHTKTEIAVDIDVFERNSQIGRDLQKEYERLDFAAGRPAPAQPKKDAEPDPSSVLGGTTMPMTTKLSLDLDLDISTIAKPKDPLKPE
jgi:hypothetical protein